MQIAGTNKDVWYPYGVQRIKGLKFEPKKTDKQIFFRSPPGWNGPTIEDVKRVKAEGAKIVFLPVGSEILLNWGTGGASYYNTTTLNRWSAVQCSSNQTASLKALDDLAPLSWKLPVSSIDHALSRLVLKKDHGSHGRGKRVIFNPHHLLMRSVYNVAQAFIPNRTEWRLHVFRDSVFSALRKDSGGAEITNLRPDFKYYRVELVPKAAVWMAIEAAKRVGLDFAGVDIIRDNDTERFYVLETNSAPGMSPVTVRRLYMAIQKAYEN